MFQSLQKLKGAIDRTIAEEQARQTTSSPSRSTSGASPAHRPASTGTVRGGKTESPNRRQRPRKPNVAHDATREGGSGSGSGTGTGSGGDGSTSLNPDPAVFEAAFVLDDSEDVSRAGTPRPVEREKGPAASATKDGRASQEANEESHVGKSQGGSDAVQARNESSSSPAPTKDGEGGSQSNSKAQTQKPTPTPSPDADVVASATGQGATSMTETPSANPSTELPLEVRVKLRKFDRLETTYSDLLRSYRIAHGRVKAIEPFERALKENTPLTSIADPHALVEYLNQLNLKSDMVMDELKRLSAEKDELRKKVAEQKAEIENLGTQLDAAKHASVANTVLPKDASQVTDDIFSFDDEMQADAAVKAEEIKRLGAEVLALKAELSETKANSAAMVGKLDAATRELSETRCETREAAALKASLEMQVEAGKAQVGDLQRQLVTAQKEWKGKLESAKSKSAALETEVARISTAKSDTESKLAGLEAQLDTHLKQPSASVASMAAPEPHISGQASQPAATSQPPASSSKKKNKKKRKGASQAESSKASTTSSAAPDKDAQAGAPASPASPATPTPNTEALETEIDRLKADIEAKNSRIETLTKQRRVEQDLHDEIETMQENLLAIGQDHVYAKQRIKQLEAELQGSSEHAAETHDKLQRDDVERLEQECEELKAKSSTLQTDLAAAQQLAQSRYKDITHLKDVLQKAQPELKSLRQESAALKTARDELATKTAEIRRLEQKEKEATAELTKSQRLLSDRDAEIKALRDKLSQETTNRVRLEDEKRVAARDLRRSEAEKVEMSAREEKASRALKQLQADMAKLRPRVRELEDRIETLQRENKALQDENELKAQQHASAQGLLGSMRDQNLELSVQLREARSQAESLDEELVEVQRLLGERTREGETMRRLLADVDERADGRVREMRGRMEAAMEERDRLEDESTTLARKKTREAEELKQKLRHLERQARDLASEKDELEQKERDWKKKRDQLESVEARAEADVSEMRAAVDGLKAALDASEHQVRVVEKQKTDLRKVLDESRQKYDKTAKDLKTAQARLSSNAGPAPGRASTESTPSSGLNGPNQGTDFLYLQSIIKQFIDNERLRLQLAPVMARLLSLDKDVEKKWMDMVKQIASK